MKHILRLESVNKNLCFYKILLIGSFHSTFENVFKLTSYHFIYRKVKAIISDQTFGVTLQLHTSYRKEIYSIVYLKRRRNLFGSQVINLRSILPTAKSLSLLASSPAPQLTTCKKGLNIIILRFFFVAINFNLKQNVFSKNVLNEDCFELKR